MEDHKSLVIWPAIIAIIAMLLALLSWPYGYYVFLKWVVCSASVYYAYTRYTTINKLDGWICVLAIVAILFNPITPVYLHDKGVWNIIDVVTTGLFIVLISTKRHG